MVSTERWSKMMARQRLEEDKARQKHWLERLRELLEAEAVNMRHRLAVNKETAGMDPAEALRGKLYDETFYDAEIFHKDAYRTKTRWETILVIAGGDKALVLREWKKALQKFLPINSKYYDWNPKFVPFKGVQTIRHNRMRKPDGPSISTSEP